MHPPYAEDPLVAKEGHWSTTQQGVQQDSSMKKFEFGCPLEIKSYRGTHFVDNLTA